MKKLITFAIITLTLFMTGCSDNQKPSFDDTRFETLSSYQATDFDSNSTTYKLKDKFSGNCYLWIRINMNAQIIETSCES